MTTLPLQRRRVILILSASALVGVAVLVASLSFGRGAAPLPFEDPGAFVRWGLPMTKMVYNLSAAVTVGGFLFLGFIIPKTSPTHAHVTYITMIGAGVWTISSVASLYLSFLTLVPIGFGDPAALEQIGYFAQNIPLGQVWTVSIILAAGSVVLALLSEQRRYAVLGLAVAAFALILMASTGHAAGDANHAAAVTALALHLTGAAIWLGGLVMLVAGSSLAQPTELKNTIQRYSTVALFGFIAVAYSGTIVAIIRLTSFENLLTPYGAILLAKIFVLILLGAAGAWNRLRLIRQLHVARIRRTFWFVVSGEIFLMFAASGLAAGLARTPPPEQETSPSTASPAESLVGIEIPRPPDLLSLLTGWRLDPLWALVCVSALLLYGISVRKLSRNGGRWPARRSAAWAAGIVVLFYATNASPALYRDFTTGSNIAEVILVALVAPALLVLGRPLALVDLITKKRKDRTTGLRETAAILRRFYLAPFVRQPALWAVAFASALFLSYFSPAYEWSLRDPFVYEGKIALFVFLGLSLTITFRASTVKRAVRAAGVFLLLTVMFAVNLQLQDEVLAADWFETLDLGWPRSPLADQRAISISTWVVATLWTAVLVGGSLLSGRNSTARSTQQRIESRS